MFSDLIQSLFANVWTAFLVIFFFGGSIFVHELGHFLAARRRGVHVERFSIGFGPPIWSRRGRDGVEYRIAWFPLGGYVLLPQLADLGAIEGESRSDPAKLPPVSYATKMIVFVAGALFNVLFAFLLACAVWAMGQTESSDMLSTRIGFVSPTLEIDGAKVPSPALQAGLRFGDVIKAIDGERVTEWGDIQNSLTLSSGRNRSGERQVIFTIERDGKLMDVTLYPRLVGDDKIRRVGVGPAYELIVHRVIPGSLAEKAGFLPSDEILRFGGEPIQNATTYRDHLEKNFAQPVTATVRRGDKEVALTLPPRPSQKEAATLGLELRTGTRTVHVSPLKQIGDVVTWTVKTIRSLISPSSDIGFSHMSGAVGIVRVLHSAAEAGIRAVFMITILLNVNLAIFNLLPLPILDGGQMLFATIARLRGRSLPVNFIAATQSVFLVLFVSLFLYVFVFDIRRWVRDVQSDREATRQAEPAKP